eukprot:jgi/Psemu1/218968/e_gw1.942.22.1
MPKAEKGSVKDIANRMKARGLQKLRFYCQMCEKQCRDANGFKCHIQSESHMRQMKIFSDNAGGFLERYSKEFETGFLTTLKMRHGTKKVNANNVYQEVIADKEHIHMNATHWTTLTEFVQYLGKSGKCVVEENHSDGTGGWYVSYIERDSGILARRASQQQREAADQKAEAALLERMKAQRIAAAKALDRAGGSSSLSATSIRGDTQECVSTLQKGLGAALSSTKLKTTKKKNTRSKNNHDDKNKNNNNNNNNAQQRSEGGTHKQQTPTDAWLYRNILVRIVSETLAGGKYFRKKAVVDRVLKNGYAAEIEVLDDSKHSDVDGDVLRLDQDDMETVIPKAGSNINSSSSSSSSNSSSKKVRILKGDFRGEKAVVESLDKSRHRAELLLLKTQRRLKKVSYDDFSQIA